MWSFIIIAIEHCALFIMVGAVLACDPQRWRSAYPSMPTSTLWDNSILAGPTAQRQARCPLAWPRATSKGMICVCGKDVVESCPPLIYKIHLPEGGNSVFK